MNNPTFRDEFVAIAREFYQVYRQLKDSVDEIMEETDFLEAFFASYASSYSLSLAYPESLWKATAENLGIDTEGKDRLQLAKEVFIKSNSLNIPETLESLHPPEESLESSPPENQELPPENE